MMKKQHLGHHLLRISISLILIGFVWIIGYNIYLSFLQKNSLIQIQTTQEAVITVQGKISLLPEKYIQNSIFWIPWNTKWICRKTCYIEVPAGRYTIRTGSTTQEIKISKGIHAEMTFIQDTTEEATSSLDTPGPNDEQILKNLIEKFPQYRTTHRKILSEEGAIIIYTEPIRVYDAKKNIMHDTLSTDEPIIIRTITGLKISYK